ncbi:HNH endonuclease [Bacillus litorisediminis]|uniref:HNH endonuclease n=1 Tax=Bacillus litorisediminis TaxID=2922713 RepID=UPI001FAF6E55|nr:HNH endonuclease [Bacillus litorisediminis]
MDIQSEELSYRNPEFYVGDYRNQFEITDKVKVNALPTLENVKDFYEVHMFNDGYIGVYNTQRNTYLKPKIKDQKDNYFMYGLRTIDNKTKIVYMHRLVGLAWLDGWQEGKFIDHKDTDKQNSLLSNLEWVTPKTNVQRAVKNNLGVGRPRVEKKIKPKLTLLQISESSSKGRNGLTYKQVESVFNMIEEGYNETFIAKKYGVTQACISQIITGKRWKTHPASKLYMQKLKAVL